MTTQARELAKLVTNAGDVNLGDDISLASDGAVLNFGADSDVTLTHVADTGLLLNSSRQLQFGDSGTFIRQEADGVLDLTSDTEIELNATTLDINANVDISGTLTVAGALDFGDLDISNVGSIALDTITNDGTNITLDSSGDIILDADGGNILFKDGSVGTFLDIQQDSSDAQIISRVQDKDIVFRGDDNGSIITALTLDMSDAGTAIFNHDIVLPDAGRIYFDGGSDTYIYQYADNNIRFIAGTTDMLSIGSNGTVFNEDSENRDFRVESNDNANMLFIDASTDRVGIGTASPANNLHIHTDAGDEGIIIKSTGDTSNAIISDANRGSAQAAILALTAKWNGTSVADILFLAGEDTTNKDDGHITFRVAAAGTPTEAMRVHHSGNVSIGNTSDDNGILSVSANKGSAGSLWTQVGPNNNASLIIQNLSSTDNTNACLYFANDAGVSASINARFVDHSDDETELRFGTHDGSNARERMVISGAGNVGLNTMSPGAMLDIANTSNNDYPLKIRGNIDNSGGFTGIVFGYESDTTSYEKAAIHIEGTSGNVEPKFQILLHDGANSTNATPANAAKFTIENDGHLHGECLINSNVNPTGENSGKFWSTSGTYVSAWNLTGDPEGVHYYIELDIQGLHGYTSYGYIYKDRNGRWHVDLRRQAGTNVQVDASNTYIQVTQGSGANQTNSSGNVKLTRFPGSGGTAVS